MHQFSRRFVCAAGIITPVSLLTGCSSPDASFLALSTPAPNVARDAALSRPNYDEVYGAYPGEQFPIDAFNYKSMDRAFLRQIVRYSGSERPGTIIVDPSARQLFLIESNQRATRFGVGVGREGFQWAGNAKINMRRSWPDWIPPREMVERDPEIKRQLVRTARGEGVPGGSKSPLGARAKYLFGKSGDLGYRIHGTTEPETIGTNVSSGCIRMINQDICYLYGRAPEGTSVVVLPSPGISSKSIV